MKVLLFGHYHCAECGRHLRDQAVSIDTPDLNSCVFWCENDKCANFGRSFMVPAAKIDLEEVRLEVVQ